MRSGEFFLPERTEGFGDGRFERIILEAEYVCAKCRVWEGDLSVFQVGDGLDYACAARVSRLFWVSTAGRYQIARPRPAVHVYANMIRGGYERVGCLMK